MLFSALTFTTYSFIGPRSELASDHCRLAVTCSNLEQENLLKPLGVILSNAEEKSCSELALCCGEGAVIIFKMISNNILSRFLSNLPTTQ